MYVDCTPQIYVDDSLVHIGSKLEVFNIAQ